MMFEAGRNTELNRRFPQLADYLRRHCGGDTCGAVSRYLVSVAAFIARRFVERRLRAAVAHEDCAPEQIAISVTANLFKKSEAGSPLCSRLGPVLDSDAALISAFLQYCISVIKNELRARLKTIDPAGFNLTERINKALDKRNYSCWPEELPQWVRLAETNDLNLTGQPWSAQDIAVVACREAGSGEPDTPTWLHSIMVAVASSDIYQRFVDIERLQEGMRMAKAQLLGNAFDTEVGSKKVDPWLMAKLHQQLAKGLASGHQYLDDYRNKGKLGDNGLKVLHPALDAYFEDVRICGDAPMSQYKYVEEVCPGLTREYYDQHYKAAFEGTVAYVWKKLREF